MNKIAAILFISIFILSNSISYAANIENFEKNSEDFAISKVQENDKIKRRHTRVYSLAPICTDGNLICVLGKYTFSSNNINKPIFASYGMMCTTDGGICTNGSQIITTNRVVYR